MSRSFSLIVVLASLTLAGCLPAAADEADNGDAVVTVAQPRIIEVSMALFDAESGVLYANGSCAESLNSTNDRDISTCCPDGWHVLAPSPTANALLCEEDSP